MKFTPLASSSHGNAYLLEDGHTRILIECGVSFRDLQKRMGFQVSELAGCLVSHEHKDHANCYTQLIKSGIPVYASEGTIEALGCGGMEEIKPQKQLAVGTFDVMPFEVFHDAAEPLGFLIRSRADEEKLVFATDTVNLAYHFAGVAIAAIECNYAPEILALAQKMPEKVRRRIENSHMSVERTCAFLVSLDRSRLREVWLLHLSDACSNEGKFIDLAERVCPGVVVRAAPR